MVLSRPLCAAISTELMSCAYSTYPDFLSFPLPLSSSRRRLPLRVLSSAEPIPTVTNVFYYLHIHLSVHFVAFSTFFSLFASDEAPVCHVCGRADEVTDMCARARASAAFEPSREPWWCFLPDAVTHCYSGL